MSRELLNTLVGIFYKHASTLRTYLHTYISISTNSIVKRSLVYCMYVRLFDGFSFTLDTQNKLFVMMVTTRYHIKMPFDAFEPSVVVVALRFALITWSTFLSNVPWCKSVSASVFHWDTLAFLSEVVTNMGNWSAKLQRISLQQDDSRRRSSCL